VFNVALVLLQYRSAGSRARCKHGDCYKAAASAAASSSSPLVAASPMMATVATWPNSQSVGSKPDVQAVVYQV
jgi:hypothetical protein